MYSWGCNQNGQLGQGDNETRILPQRLKCFENVDFEAIECGSRFSIALSKLGHVYSWGKGSDGQLGHGTGSSTTIPTLISALEGIKVKAIATKGSHSLAVSESGILYSWGRNEEGQLGISTARVVKTPEPVTFFTTNQIKVLKVSCGRNHSMVLSERGVLYAMGSGEEGAIGLGHNRSTAIPQPVVYEKEVVRTVDISCGSRHNLALCLLKGETVRLFAWGWNAYGQVGTGDRENRYHPHQVAFDTSLPESNLQAFQTDKVISISCGYRHSLAVFRVSSRTMLFSWGWNQYGQCGLHTDKRLLLQPCRVESLPDDHQVCDVQGGGRHTLLALQHVPGGARSLYAFGRNDDGQLGLEVRNIKSLSSNVFSFVATPLKVSLPSVDVHLIAAGWSHSLCVSYREGSVDSQAGSSARTSWRNGEATLWGALCSYVQPVAWRDYLASCLSFGNVDAGFAQTVNTLLIFLIMLQTLQVKVGFPAQVIAEQVLSGAACTIFIGNLVFAGLAVSVEKELSRAGKHRKVTALPHGINTVLLFAFTMLILFPVYQKTRDYTIAYKTGLACCFLLGALELVVLVFVDLIQRVIPAAAMLAALSGISLTFISMTFFVPIFQAPLIGILPMFIVLISYGANVRFPLRIPATLLSLLFGVLLEYMVNCFANWGIDLQPRDIAEKAGYSAIMGTALYLPTIHIQDILETIVDPETVPYITSVVFPMLIINVVNNVTCIESGASVGDVYRTKTALLLDSMTTIIGAMLGNPFPTSIYIGHPAFKSMGADSGYNVINAVLVLVLGVCNGVPLVNSIIPQVSTYGLLVWIGLCVTTDGYKVNDSHKVAVTIGMLPALSAFIVHYVMIVFNALHEGFGSKDASFPEAVHWLEEQNLYLYGLIALSKGYLLSSIFLSATMVHIVEREFFRAAMWMLCGSFLSFVGLVHSFEVTEFGTKSNFGFPAVSSKDNNYFSLQYAGAYSGVAILLLLLEMKENDRSLHPRRIKKAISRFWRRRRGSEESKTSSVVEMESATEALRSTTKGFAVSERTPLLD